MKNSKEQEEAIERLEKRIKDNEDYKTTQVWLTDDVSAVYTVLNMLKEKDKEIEKYKILYKKALSDAVTTAHDNIQLKKQIDLMAEEIAKNIMNTCPLGDYDYDLDCENRCNNNYKECWKIYFERKANNEN